MENGTTLLHVGDPERGRCWQAELPALVPGLRVRQWPDIGDPAAIRYLAAWDPPDGLIASLPNLELLFSVGAGVDHLDVHALPPGLPVVRMIEDRLTEEMVEYAVFATLALHRDMLHYFALQRTGQWSPRQTVPAAGRGIGIMGLGVIGTAVATRLATFGFKVSGWSRTQRTLPGITCHSGPDVPAEFLAASEILLCLLPLTRETHHILDARLFALLPRGAALISMGRGAHLDEAGLIAALDDGRLSGAIVDVLDSEPPSAGHPFWADPRILVTPHIAGTTDHHGGARAIAENIRRHRTGTPLRGVVDRRLGY
jgi:glyoxylate/hydroxypyruvate reductase A